MNADPFSNAVVGFDADLEKKAKPRPDAHPQPRPARQCGVVVIRAAFLLLACGLCYHLFAILPLLSIVSRPPKIDVATLPFPHPVDATYPPVDPSSASPLAPWRLCPSPWDEDALECTYARVPTDWFNASKGNTYIAVARFPATAKPEDQLGAIYLNEGGPGVPGTDFVSFFGKTLHILTHGRYDIIGIDTRGMGATRPTVDCFGSTKAHQIFKAGTVLERPFDVAPDPFSEAGRAHLLRQWTELQALRKTQMQICEEKMGDAFTHMGTSDVVRDISFINFEARLGKGHPIHYLGYSYGSILGQYLANMLPASSLGHIVIDGVSSARRWSSTPAEHWITNGWLVDTDKTYMANLRECSDVGPEACPLAKEKGEDPQKIAKRLSKFTDDLYDQPLPVLHGPRPGILTSGIVRAWVYLATNFPAMWQYTTKMVAEALDGDGTQLLSVQYAPIIENTRVKVQTELARAAVSCADSPPFNNENFGNWSFPTPEDLTERTLRSLRNTSQFAAVVPSLETDGGCQWFPARNLIGRFNGPWNNTLDLPMLVISNAADPVTPRAFGEEAHQLNGNSSRMLIMDIAGHTTLSAVSSCHLDALQRYFLHDELPKDGKVCRKEQGNFDAFKGVPATGPDPGIGPDGQVDLHQLSRFAVWRFTRNFFPPALA